MTPVAWALQPIRRYADFRGRSRRREFWWYSLLLTVFAVVFFFAVGIVIGISGLSQQAMNGVIGILEIVWILATILPSLAVSVRRLHDTGRSGWWMLLSLVPLIGGIVLLIFECQDSQPNANKWGPNPKNAGVFTVATNALVRP